MDAEEASCNEVLRLALRCGVLEDTKRLLDSTIQHDPDRVLFTCCLPDGKILSKPTPHDVKKYIEFLGILAQKQATGLHVAQIRSGLLTHDQGHNHQLTKTVNAMWRLSWAKTESEKVSLLWQFCLCGIKREGVSLLKEINELKKLWYPEPCHDLLGLSKTTIHRNSKPLAN